ncbi:MAG TPA: histidinol-phosphate transaminase [Acidimicrobiales bacterium]|nr:histidinol-phosphate transaminase [Acidimicrobiales bacterium]
MSSAAPIAPRDDLALREGYHSPQVEVEVRLNTNESPYGPPEGFAAALAEELATIDWNRYPDRAALALRTDIGALHGVGPEQVFAANGSNEVLQTVLLTYGGLGRRAAVFEPTYALHSHLARITGTGVVTGERGADYSLDVDDVRDFVDRHVPAVVFLCSPNNPTGRTESRRVIEAMAADTTRLTVVDEAYGQFADRSALDLVAEDRPFVVTRTFSKTWAMAGARLGYLIGPTWLVAELEKVVLPYHLDAAKQIAGRVALRFGDEMQARVATLREERGRLVGRLTELDVDVVPSDANFVLFRPRSVDAEVVWQRLVDASVLVRNCASWPRLEGCLRVTVGTQGEDDRFLDALEEILRS